MYGVSKVKLLDGGRKKWEAENLPLDNRTPEYPATQFKAKTANSELRARLADAVAVVEGKSNAQLIDIRSPDEYQGKIFAPQGVPELSVRAGHIPGAVNVPWGKAVNEDGTFKSVEELKKLYASVGIDGSKPIITYCRIGERSSHTWFALTRLLGYKVKNYDGSWTEYGNAVGVPIANPRGHSLGFEVSSVSHQGEPMHRLALCVLGVPMRKLAVSVALALVVTVCWGGSCP